MDPRPSELSRRVEPFAAAMADDGTALVDRALALSKVLQPSLDPAVSHARLDGLARSCPGTTRVDVIEHLFGSGMLRGDRQTYHHWRNSCVDQVLHRMSGMPITLAIVGITVAARLGVELVGVGMPGHFLIGDPHDRDWFADPFGGRSSLTRPDCRQILDALGGPPWSEAFLAPTPDRQVVVRLLNNLKLGCERSRDAVRLALVMRARQELPEFAAEATTAHRAAAVFN